MIPLSTSTTDTRQTEQQSDKLDRRTCRENDRLAETPLHPIWQLQEVIGNRAVGRMLRSGDKQLVKRLSRMPLLQARLTVRPVGDKYEQKQTMSQLK